MNIKHLLVFLAILPWSTGYAQPVKNDVGKASQTFTAMFYNVENLYDTKNDPATDDDEFTPSGLVPWTEARLQTKIEHIGEVISAIEKPAMPDIIGMAEVENRQVLEMLTGSALLLKTGYGIVHYDSPDERGIDVAMLYNPATFHVVSSDHLQVILPQNDRTRDILFVKGKLSSGAFLYVFINHWPSRREGSDVSEPKRMAAASVLRSKIDELRKSDPAANILIMGDFNDEPSDNSIVKGLGACIPEKKFRNTALYSLLYPEFTSGQGSLYYKDWDLFDQIIVSGNMLSRSKGIHTSVQDAGIFKADWLLFKPKSGEPRPNRTMGNTYFGGYSDHLPVFVKFSLN